MKCRKSFISNSSSSSFIITTDVFDWTTNKNFRNRDPKTGRFIKSTKEIFKPEFVNIVERKTKMTQKKEVYVKELVDPDLEYEEFLKLLATKHEHLKSQGVEKVFIECDSGYGNYVILYGYRIETDDEFNSRISDEIKTKENRKNNLKSALAKFSKDCPEEFEQLMKEI